MVITLYSLQFFENEFKNILVTFYWLWLSFLNGHSFFKEFIVIYMLLIPIICKSFLISVRP